MRNIIITEVLNAFNCLACGCCLITKIMWQRMFTAIVLIWIIVLLLRYYLTRRHIVELARKLPGPTGYPFVGNALVFMGSPEKVFRLMFHLCVQYKRMAALWIGPWLHVIIFTAKDTEAILKASKNTVKADEYRFLRPWLGESILISEGAKFKKNKKLLMPAFHTPNLKQYLEVFSEHAAVLVDELKLMADTDKEFDVHPRLNLLALFVLLETSMGVKKETLGLDAVDYAKAVEKLGRCAHKRVYKLWQRSDIVFRFSDLKKEQDKYLNIVHPLTERVIHERKKEYLAGKETGEKPAGKSWTIFLDRFIEAKDEFGLGLTDQEIKDEVMTMMFAGQDTTTVSIGFALCLLGLHQTIQDRLLDEIDVHFGGSERPVNYDDCKELIYMEQVIQEAWRLYPPIPLIAKSPTVDIDLGDCSLPKGCTVALVIMTIHRDPSQYPDPDTFNPDNFLPERIKERNPYSFIPFSAGHRTCIGQKYAMLLIKVILVYILRKYRVFSTIPMIKYKLAGQTTLKRRDGFQISLKQRCRDVAK